MIKGGPSLPRVVVFTAICIVAVAITPNCVNDDDSSGEQRHKCGCDERYCGFMDEYTCCDPTKEACCGDAPGGNQLCCPLSTSICVNCEYPLSESCDDGQTGGRGYGCCPTSNATTSVPCSGHGVCFPNTTSIERGAVACKCIAGYSGLDCSVQDGV